MKENTKKYLSSLIEDITIHLNTTSFVLNDAEKTRRSLQKLIKRLRTTS